MSDTLDECREQALRLLDHRMHTVEELRRKLRRKGRSANDVDEVIGGFVRTGLLNDRLYAETYCQEKLGATRPTGTLKVRHDLRRRGIAAETAEEVLAEWESEDSEETEMVRALRAGEGKLRLIKAELPRRDAYGRLCRFLAGRGFPPPVCREAAERLLDTREPMD